jgi:subtilisin family serine protease
VRRVRFLLLAVLPAALFLAQPAQAVGNPPQTTWHSTQIRLGPALKAGWNGSGVTVAVLDGWVDTTHPDFEHRAIASADCTSGTCTATMGADQCGNNHGTHVAGSISSSSYGVAPRSRLLVVRVLKAQDASDPRSDCVGDPKSVAAGINWAVAHGARVLNLSLGPDVPGQTTNGPIAQAVAAAADSGVVVVFSAGNADLPVAQSYGNDALVVAATGPSGGLASYSQHGQGISVAAPGGQPTKDAQGNDVCSQSTCVTSLWPGNQIAVAAGTSMAAPQVAGLAALLLQQRPGRGRADVVNRIESTARPLAQAGHGVVDVSAALGVRTVTASPTPRRTTATQRPTPQPTHAVVRAATSPSPLAVPTTPPASGSPSPTASAAPSPLAGDPLGTSDDEVPLAVAGLAGALVGLAGTGVLLSALGRRT